jgi:hypothetical protein
LYDLVDTKIGICQRHWKRVKYTTNNHYINKTILW